MFLLPLEGDLSSNISSIIKMTWLRMRLAKLYHVKLSCNEAVACVYLLVRTFLMFLHQITVMLM